MNYNTTTKPNHQKYPKFSYQGELFKTPLNYEKEFWESLPSNPYLQREKGKSLEIRSKRSDLTPFKNLQFNQINEFSKFVIDFDNEINPYDLMHECTVALPNLIINNEDNNKAHLFYMLENPVHNNQNSSKSAKHWLNAIQTAYTMHHQGDPNYSGFIAKNPYSKRHSTTILNPYLYQLRELAYRIDLPSVDCRRKFTESGIGRNCTLFDNLRRWGYKNYRLLGYPSYEYFYTCLENQADIINNNFTSPLHLAEIRHTVKSICKYITNNNSEAGFSESQAWKGSKGGKKSKRYGELTSERTNKPWLKLGVSRRTYYYHKAKENNCTR